MSIPPTDTVPAEAEGDDAFIQFMEYDSGEHDEEEKPSTAETKTEIDEWSSLVEEQRVKDSAAAGATAAVPHAVPASGIVKKEHDSEEPCFSVDTEPVIAGRFGLQLPGTATSRSNSQSLLPVPLVYDARPNPSAVLEAWGKPPIPKQMIANDWWPVHDRDTPSGGVPRASGNWDGSEMEEVTAEEATNMDVRAQTALSRRQLLHQPYGQYRSSHPVYMPNYDFLIDEQPSSLDFGDVEEIPLFPSPLYKPMVDDKSHGAKSIPVALWHEDPFGCDDGCSTDDDMQYYDPERYGASDDVYAKKKHIAVRPSPPLEFPKPQPRLYQPPARHSEIDTRRFPGSTLGQTTHLPPSAMAPRDPTLAARDQAAAMARKVRNQRSMRSQMRHSGGSAAFSPPVLPRTAEFPTGMPHNHHHWDPMALGHDVSVKHGTIAADKKEEQRIEDYERLMSEDAASALNSEHHLGYHAPPFMAHRASPHSTQSRAAFGLYQPPTLSDQTGGPNEFYDNFPLYEEDRFQYPTYPTPALMPHISSPYSTYNRAAFDAYQPPTVGAGPDDQHASAASQAMFDVHVTNFCDYTQVTPEIAAEWLRRFNGNYAHAVQCFFSQ
jgi:hypothetical protein